MAILYRSAREGDFLSLVYVFHEAGHCFLNYLHKSAALFIYLFTGEVLRPVPRFLFHTSVFLIVLRVK